MALYVCENINEDIFVIINKQFSTKFTINIKVYKFTGKLNSENLHLSQWTFSKMNLRHLAANLITKNVVASVLSSMLKHRGQCDRNRSYATRESSTNNEIEIGRSLLTTYSLIYCQILFRSPDHS